MDERASKFSPHYTLLFWIACFTIACSLSSGDGKSTVINPRPTPQFSIPDKIPGVDYLYFIAIGDQGKGGKDQRHVASLMNDKAGTDSLDFVITLMLAFPSPTLAQTSLSRSAVAMT